MHAFLATYDLRFSVYLTTFLMHSFGKKLPSVIDKSSLWNYDTLFIIFKLSNTFCQSWEFKLLTLYLNCDSGLINGSSGEL